MASCKKDAELEAIEKDDTLSAAEKAMRRNALMAQRALKQHEGASTSKQDIDPTLTCGICLELCERPVTAPCQHNCCLGCFRSLVSSGCKECPTCRAHFPKSFLGNPRVNTMLAMQIRNALKPSSERKANARTIRDSERPDTAYRTENAKRGGLSNAASGKLKVSCRYEHFGPIGPEFDLENGTGLLVGSQFTDRMHCRQYGAHLPHVAGIAGQSELGAQSVVLSGGYDDDYDDGDWFLYTGSGGRDLSGNKRTNDQTYDQEFTLNNLALLRSCERGLPVRVVRSCKEKRSEFAPPADAGGKNVRYDGCYLIQASWRSDGSAGHKVCRYLFRRADNEAAPWASRADQGDGPWDMKDMPQLAKDEIEGAIDVTFAGEDPFWAYDEEQQQWAWAREQPKPKEKQRSGSKVLTEQEALERTHATALRALDKWSCTLCKDPMSAPVTTPCGHNYCMPCLLQHFKVAGENASRNASKRASRSVRVRKPCPKRDCGKDLSDFMTACQVNQAMATQVEAARAEVVKAAAALAEHNGQAVAAEDSAEAQERARQHAALMQEEKAQREAQRLAVLEAAAAKLANAKAALVKEFAALGEEVVACIIEDQNNDCCEARAVLRKMLQAHKKAANAESKAIQAGCTAPEEAAAKLLSPKRDPLSEQNAAAPTRAKRARRAA